MEATEAEDLERLREVAAGMDDLFELELPDAPGMAFVGGRFSVRAAADDVAHFSAGAADEDRQRAFRRCVGEVIETQAQFIAGRDNDFARRRTPDVENLAGLMPLEQALLERLAGEETREIAWLPSRRLSDGAPSCLPMALCLRDVPGIQARASSLGCAAGRTLAEATRSAVLELVERDAIALWWRGGGEARAIEPQMVPRAQALLGECRAGAAGRATRFLDITSDLGVPVVAAVSFDRDGRSVAAGFASRPSRDAAACAALRELAQMELGNRMVMMKLARGGLSALAAIERRQLERIRELGADDERLVGRATAQTAVDAREDLAGIVSLVAAAGIEAHCVDLTLPESGIPVVKVLAPLLQAEPGGVVTPRLARMCEMRGISPTQVPSLGLI